MNEARSGSSLGFVIWASLTAALGGLLFGYDTAVIAGTVEFLQSHFELSDMRLGWTVSSALLGCMGGALLAGVLGDKLGRKKAMMMCASLFFVSAIWSGLARSPAELVAARILGGLGVGAASMLTPIYISEIAPARIRGALTTLNQVAILTGMVVVYIVNARLAVAGDEVWRVTQGWRWMFGSEALPALLFLVMLIKIPESPRWLVMQGREAEAEALLKRLGQTSGVDQLVQEIQASARQREHTYADLLRSPIRRIFLIGAVLAILQQMTGINIVMYYAPRIFISAGLDTSSAIGHSVIIGIIMMLFTFVAMALADRVGRRPLLLVSTAGMTLGLFMLGRAYVGGAEGQAWNLLIWVLVYVGSFSIGMGPLVWTVLGEIFPNRIRAHAAGVCVLLLWLANFLVSQFFPWLLSTYAYKVFWIYGVVCLVTLVFMAIWVPETRGRTLEELEQDLT